MTGPADNPIRSLLIEDSAGEARLLREAVAEVGIPRVEWCHLERLGDALRRLEVERFDVMLLDLSLPDSHGFETFARARAATDMPILVLTGLDDEDLALRTVQEGAQDYLVKSQVTGPTVVRAMRYAIERCRILNALREKTDQLELSIREAHHRIKNNLQAISDLLYLQLTSGSGASVEEALQGSIERIQAIATVHDLLSKDQDVRVVDARAVMERLIPMVLRGSGIAPDRVETRVEVAPVPLSAKRATSLALIVNELITNATRHAFRGGRGGELAISLRQESEELVLRIQDDGPGLPAGFDMLAHARVGLDVVRTLVERDLNGCFRLLDRNGVTAEVRFVW